MLTVQTVQTASESGDDMMDFWYRLPGEEFRERRITVNRRILMKIDDLPGEYLGGGVTSYRKIIDLRRKYLESCGLPENAEY